VVDNASGDDSVGVLARAIDALGFAAWASVLASASYGGFAAGNNLAIAQAMASAAPPDLFWLLNPDTVVRPQALVRLVEFLRAHPNVGICGSGIDEGDGTPWPFAFRFPSVLGEVEQGFAFGPVSRLLGRFAVRHPMGAEPARVDWVSGCSMVVRRQVVERIGPMDEGFFLYFEETDFCLRAHRAGFECWYLPTSRILHIAGQSTSVTAKTDRPRRLPRYWFDSRRRYFVRSHGRLYTILADVAWMTAFVLGRCRRWLQRLPPDAPPHYLGDFCRHSALWCRDLDGHAHRPVERRGA
jgi:N-acetylglucosaminyl-diphospho-decaprenol L-rhamnosyltransferase